MFYIAHYQYPVRWTAQSTLHFCPPPGTPVHSDTKSTSLGSILAMQQLCVKTKSLTYPPLSIDRYSFIKLKLKMPKLRNGSKRGLEPGLSQKRV